MPDLAQCKVITELAEKGACVIIGRCADYVLRSKFPTLNIFIHAPLEMRIKRIMEYNGCTEKQAVQKIIEAIRQEPDTMIFLHILNGAKSRIMI